MRTSSESVTSATLSVFEEAEANAALSVGEVVDRVRQRYDDANRTPGANADRGRLTQLTKEGFLERPERGTYVLRRTEPNRTDDLATRTSLVADVVRADAFRRTVLWDAHPASSSRRTAGPGDDWSPNTRRRPRSATRSRPPGPTARSPPGRPPRPVASGQRSGPPPKRRPIARRSASCSSTGRSWGPRA